MSPLSRSQRLLKTAEAVLIAAIEIYNKPDFSYREQTFSILATNAWEILLKAKLLALHQNDVRCLYARDKGNDAVPTGIRYKRNRTGNTMTIGIDASMVELQKAGTAVPPAVKANLEALVEIRDNAVHFINASPVLAKQVLEIGTASLRNFIELGKRWMDLDLSSYSLYLMPIGFLPPATAATAISVTPDEQNVVNYLAGLIGQPQGNGNSDYHVSLDVNISFKRTTNAAAAAVIVTNDPNAVPVTITEETVRKQYPWDYAELVDRLKKRYIDFKQNPKFNAIKATAVANPQYMRPRYLDPDNPNSSRKDFYNSNILTEFDRHYTLRK